MAIKIDLLPGYVGLRHWFKRLAVLCATLVVATGVILYLFYAKGQGELETMQTNLANIEPIAAQKEAADQAAQATQAQTAPYQGQVTFIVDAGRTGTQRSALVDLVRQYIYQGAYINLLDLSDGQTVKINAAVKTPDDYARFVNDLRQGSIDNNGPLFGDLAVATGVPGFGNRPPPRTVQQGSFIAYPLNVTATSKLKNPVTVPVEPGGAAAGGTGAAAPGGGPAPSGSGGPVGSSGSQMG